MVDQPEAVRIAVLESQIKGLKENILLQAREYERRLTELNHAHQQQIDRNAHYVSREAWEARNKEVDIRLSAKDDETQVRFAALERWQWMTIGGATVIAALISLAISKLNG